MSVLILAAWLSPRPNISPGCIHFSLSTIPWGRHCHHSHLTFGKWRLSFSPRLSSRTKALYASLHTSNWADPEVHIVLSLHSVPCTTCTSFAFLSNYEAVVKSTFKASELELDPWHYKARQTCAEEHGMPWTPVLGSSGTTLLRSKCEAEEVQRWPRSSKWVGETRVVALPFWRLKISPSWDPLHLCTTGLLRDWWTQGGIT